MGTFLAIAACVVVILLFGFRGVFGFLFSLVSVIWIVAALLAP